LRPRRTMNFLLNGSTTKSSTTTGGVKTSTTSNALATILNFNPSRHLSFNARFSVIPTFTQNYSVSSRLPGTLQGTLNYSRNNTGTDSVGISASLTPSRYIFISSSYQKTFTHNVTGDNSSSFSINLSLRK
jgi:hypothetical protein